MSLYLSNCVCVSMCITDLGLVDVIDVQVQLVDRTAHTNIKRTQSIQYKHHTTDISTQKGHRRSHEAMPSLSMYTLTPNILLTTPSLYDVMTYMGKWFGLSMRMCASNCAC